MDIRISTKGVPRTLKRLRRLGRAADYLCVKVLNEEMETALRESMANTPIDTGALLRSHRISRAELSKGLRRGVEGAIHVGDEKAWYARIVHWSKSPKASKSHFLLHAAENRLPSLSRRFKQAVVRLAGKEGF